MKDKNPFQSRSTIIVIVTLLTLIVIVFSVLRSGFWDGSFGGMCILILREIVAQAFGHQLQADKMKTTSSITSTINPPVTP